MVGASEVPQVILHIGSPKTGTTMLQHTFAASANYLGQRGIIQPACALTKGGNAILLGYQIFDHHAFEADRNIWLHCSQQDAIATANRSWLQLMQSARAKPNQILIGAERFMQHFPPASFENASKHLNQISPNIKIVAYLRAPADMFLALHQEQLKNITPNAQTITTSEPIAQRDGISAIIAAFKARISTDVALHHYHRPSLVQNDIVADFCHYHLNNIELQRLTRPNVDLNQSISAEALAIAMDIRMGRLTIPAPNQMLRALLLGNDFVVTNPTRPNLYDNARHSITNWYAPDLFALRDQHGFTFPQVDYAALVPTDFDRQVLQYHAIEQICPVNADRKAAILRRLQVKAKLPRLLRRWAAKW